MLYAAVASHALPLLQLLRVRAVGRRRAERLDLLELLRDLDRVLVAGRRELEREVRVVRFEVRDHKHFLRAYCTLPLWHSCATLYTAAGGMRQSVCVRTP